MASKLRYQVTYTKDKRKKRPKELDGVLVQEGDQLRLQSDSGEALESISSEAQIELGEYLDFPSFRVYVDYELTSSRSEGQTTTSAAPTPALQRSKLHLKRGPLHPNRPLKKEKKEEPTERAFRAPVRPASSVKPSVASSLTSASEASMQSHDLHPSQAGNRSDLDILLALESSGPVQVEPSKEISKAPSRNMSFKPKPLKLDKRKDPSPPLENDVEMDFGYDPDNFPRAAASSASQTQTYQAKSASAKAQESLAWLQKRSVDLQNKSEQLSASLSSSGSKTANQSNLRRLLSDLEFILAEEGQKQIRKAVIPVSFTGATEYRRAMTLAIAEQINLQLSSIASHLFGMLCAFDLSKLGSDQGNQQDADALVPCCKHGPAVSRYVRKDGKNKGRKFYACGQPQSKRCDMFQWADAVLSFVELIIELMCIRLEELDARLKSQDFRLFSSCCLEQRKWRSKKGRIQYEDEWFLELPRKENHKIFAKCDLWIVSSTINFSPQTSFLAVSTFHGPNSSNQVEILPLRPIDFKFWGNCGQVFAVHTLNVSTEVSCLENLNDNLSVAKMPLLPHLLSSSVNDADDEESHSLFLTSKEIKEAANRFVETFSLNTDQASILFQIAEGLPSLDKMESLPAICLCHGVFGAGKSFLISVVIIFLSEIFKSSYDQADHEGLNWRILISSTTNVAVDCVLQSLLSLGYDDFVRVGSARKIARNIIPLSTHGTAPGDKEEIRDLQRMMKEATSPEEQREFKKIIETFKKGGNRDKLASATVVGVTCAAASFACLDGQDFPVVILDECCQMTEPNALLSIAKFSCRSLVLVGDPKQLCPTVNGAEAAHSQGLEQTMFERLSKLGIKTTMLRTQYRCHPWISAICNDLFYSNQLLDGVSIEQRQPLVACLPSLCFLDIPFSRERQVFGGSWINESEAEQIVKIINFLLASGIQGTRIGVISVYKAQAAKILERMGGVGKVGPDGIQVSTVDAFQGGEKDIILLSTVRTDAVGFIDAEPRVNVAISRARHHLAILGHASNLGRNKLWQKVISHCRSHSGGFKDVREQIQLFLDAKALAAAKEKEPEPEPIGTEEDSDEEPVQAPKAKKARAAPCIVDEESDQDQEDDNEDDLVDYLNSTYK